MTPRQKLELTWNDKEKRPRLEPRIFIEDEDLSYQAAQPVTDHDQFDNRLIFGDNLLALKALEAEFSGKIKCIYIDPPYNTGSAYDHYDDGLEHSTWLSMMRERLLLLRCLLTDDGVIFVQIDDHEYAHLRLLMDELFGYSNFVTTIVWQKKYGTKSDAKFLSDSHDYILVFARDKSSVQINRLARTPEMDSRYKNPDDDPRGPWKSGDLLRNEARGYAIYPITGPSGKTHWPPNGTSWRFTKERYHTLLTDNRIWFGRNGHNVPSLKRFLSEVTETVPATTWLEHKEGGHNDEAKREIRALLPDVKDLFPTPKPERLLKRLIELGSSQGDWILDSFAGSGTTGAVAHKMGRRWIMVEQGKHCQTHIIPRLKSVIDGTDQGGISKATDWQGGGGFRYFRLAPSLVEKDAWGNPIISKYYNADMLAEAMCKFEGFTYAPSDTFYWQHGHSTERDFIYVTTQTLTHQQLAHLSDEVGDERTLLVCCAAFRPNPDAFPNLTLTKIPNAILNRCEFGVDDYSLTIAESGNGTGTALTPDPSPVDTGEESLVQPTPTSISPFPAPAAEGSLVQPTPANISPSPAPAGEGAGG